ncbi:protein ELFN1 [Erinaceus europaeus]|uniref:Protein ELFN1 n=1 Tax=Erinaceus europaeus TaxID=9365 RepID=A0A1S3WDU4_ERIEU|nr:protein ELFN1 [Erinaceus europaeus]XP_060029158.1 protein ELFN1 [Erinaceus europaeus]XP_060029159.1 protein ELFN1 [Erinaceus europaeus]
MASRRWGALWALAALLAHAGGPARADCWLIEGDKGFVWLAICSQNQPPYEAVPQHINNTVVDLRLNENRIRALPSAALSRFANLTYLNLTKNEIGYVEDGAFSGQFNLQVLQLGYNRLRNLTEGVLRGLARLEYLYLQANLIELVTPGAFRDCPSLVNVDLSLNRIQRLHGATFAGLARLSVCELYSNPFFCSCELLGFLRWLAHFANATHAASERVQCESPPPYAGYFLLGRGHSGPPRSILAKLLSVCTDGGESPVPPEPRPPPGRSPAPPPAPPAEPSWAPCADDDSCFSGDGTTPPTPPPTRALPAESRPLLMVKQLTASSATLWVQLPSPFTRMYTLARFQDSRPATVSRLTKAQEEIRLAGLQARTNYTYCVVSTSAGLHHNHTCLTLGLPRPPAAPAPAPGPAGATQSVVAVLGCLFGLLLALGALHCCLRRRRRRGEKHAQAAAASAGGLAKTIIELQYGAEAEAAGLAPGALLGPEALARVPFPPAEAEPAEATKAKAGYMEVRTAEAERREGVPGPDGQASAAEICTIAKEVDKVNQIINNCIDALKAEAAAFPGAKAAPGPEPLAGTHSFLAAFPDTFARGQPTRGLAPGSLRAPAEPQYVERGSPPPPLLAASAALLREPDKARAYAEHRHSYPGPHAQPPLLPPEGPGGRKASILEPLTRPRLRDPAYSPLSPQYRAASYVSEGPARASLGIWERLRLGRRRARDGDEDDCVAAGHALRRKVQFAKDEDLHDILDYWKGVSAQHKA